MPLDVNEFANKIKAKYPEYKDVDNNLLAEKMIEKYPEYKGKVSFDPPKKKVATALPSEQPKVSSSSATPKTVEQKPSVSSGSEDNIFSGYPGQQGAEYRIVNGVWEKKSYGKDAYTPIVNDNSVKSLNAFFKQKGKKADERLTQASTITKGINAELLDADEEDLVPKLKGMFKGTDNDIFNIEQTGAGYDAVKITNKYTGESTEISIDNWTKDRNGEEAKLLKGFIDVNLQFKDQAINKKKIQDLQDRMYKIQATDKTGAMLIQQQIDDLKKDVDADETLKKNYAISKGKYSTQAIYNKGDVKAVSNTIKAKQGDAIVLKEDKKKLDLDKKEADEKLATGEIDQAEYDFYYKQDFDQRQQEIFDRAKSLDSDLKSLAKDSKKIDIIAGQYVSSQENRGNIVSGTASSFLKGAATGVVGLPSFFMSLDQLARDSNESMDFKDISDQLAEMTEVGGASKEYATSENRSMLEKAMFGISESIGQVAAGVGTSSVVSMMGASYLNFRSEIDGNPETKDIPAGEKVLLASALAAPIAILDKFGLDEALTKNPYSSKAINWILGKTFSSLPKNASKEVLESAIKSNLKAAVSKGLLTATEKGFIEGSTEALETNVEMGTKAIYNWAKGGEYFNTPKNAAEWWKNTSDSFVIGAIGGAVLNGATQAVNIPIDKMNMSDLGAAANSVVDKDMKEMILTSLKSKVATGEMSKVEAKEIEDNMNNLESIITKVPEDLTDEAKFNSVMLINEKAKLEKSIEGKDKALVTAQTDRINAINEELKAISINNSKTQQDAVKESEQQEVPTEGSTIEYQGANEGQQEVGQGEGSERTAEKPEANISDSNISSEEAQVILPTKNKAGEITGYISQVTDADGNVVDIEGKTEAEVQQKIDDVQQSIEQPTLDELKTLDVTDKTNLQKVQSFLDNALNDLDSFGKETLGMNLPVAVARVVLKTVKTLVDAGVSLEQAFKQAAETHNVQEVDIADTLTAISNKKKSTEASKAAKNISKKEKTKVTVDEYSALRDQIRLEARAAKDVKKKQAEMIEAINTSSNTGKISAPKAKALINRIQKVKLESDKSVNEFLNYVERIFKDAEYGDKLSKSQSYRAKIRKGIKREGVQAQVVGTLKAFSKIDPKKVENIDEYKAYAEQLTEASKTTRVTAENKVEFKQPAELADINKYTAEELKRQEDINKKELMDEFDSLVEQGLIDDSMSLNDMKKYIDSLETTEEDTSKKKETEVRKYVDAKFKNLSTIINEMISSGKDVFTDEDLDISKKDMQRLKDIMNINLDKLKLKDAFQVVEHLDNFITNGITSNLDNIQATYDGQINAENIEKSGLKSRDLKLYFSQKIGQFWGKQFMSLPTFMDNIFGGEKSSLRVAKSMGLTNFMNSKAQAIIQHRTKMAEHKKMFENKKPNGENFNSSKNISERGIFAYLLRTPIDGDANMFNERVSNTLITIDKLLASKNKKDNAKGEALNAAADKLGLRDSDVTIESVTANVDPINQQDVDWWVNTWGEIYDELSDVSLAVYNIELSPDSFYTTDTISDTNRTDAMLDDNLSALGTNMRTVDSGRTGVLKENNRHKVTAKSSTMINFNFDANQDRAFKAALVDLHTAKDIRQMKSFLKSDNFKNIMSSSEDAELFTLKVANAIKRSKGKSLEDSDRIEKEFETLANRAASLGTSMVLGRPTQLILQTLPVLGNTLINSGDLNIRNMFDADANNFVANSGRGIALRGKDALSMIESFEKYLDKNPESKIGKAMDAFDNLNNWWLKTFLVNADTFTANTSWLAYYEQSLRKQGIHPGGKIDWANHKMNEEAADYAQHKIDRQQNISDPDFGGELFTSKTPLVRVVSKVIMPFSNFTMNQKSRMYADLKAIKTSTDPEEVKSAKRSLAGLSVETVIYRGLSGLIGYGLWTMANGSASDEEKEKKKKQAFNSSVSQVATDVFSLAPSVNSQTIGAANLLMKYPQYWMNEKDLDLKVSEENKKREENRKPKMGTAEEEEFRRLLMEDKIFQIDEYQKDGGFGVFSIASEKKDELVNMYDKYLNGEYLDENPMTGEKTTKYLSEEDRKDMMLPMMLQSLHVLRLLPQEVSQYSRNMNKAISKNALSPKQFDKYNEMKKVMKLDTDKQYVMDIVKSASKLENSIEELKYIEENGGFTDKEYKEFLILKKEYGRSALGLIDNIKSGKTAKQIMGK